MPGKHYLKIKLYRYEDCAVPVTWQGPISLIFKDIFHANKTKMQQENGHEMLRVHREIVTDGF